MPSSRSRLAVLLVACAFLLAAHAQEPKPDVPAQYFSTAIGEAGAAAGKTFGLNIYLDSITSDADIQELVGILRKNGQSALVSAMEKMKDAGRVSPNAGVGTGMRIVRVHPNGKGGVHIVLATDRPISFGELWNGTRSRDYPIAIVTLDVDQNGKGSGQFAPLCKVRFNKNNELEIETYGQKPFRLANVYRQK